MRNPRNDTLGVKAAKKAADDTIRRCILSGEREVRDHLVRLVLSPGGEVLPDVRAKAAGRGAWIGVDRRTFEAAQAKGRLRGALARAFKTQDFRIPDDLGERIEHALERNALDRMGLEARAGNLLTGSEKIEAAARSGQLNLLAHACDAGADGAGKLAQAWRVGSDTEGSGAKGLELPVGRSILSLALGRENVVHIGLTDARAAKRMSEALGRWLHFIGLERANAPCETASRGASAMQPTAQRMAATNRESE